MTWISRTARVGLLLGAISMASSPSLAQEVLVTRDSPKRSVNLSIDFTSLSYKQTGKANYSCYGVTPKIGYFQRISRATEFRADAFTMPVTLSSSNEGTSVFLYGMSARFGLKMRTTRGSFLSLLGGGFYETMSSSSRHFGYTDIAGPRFSALWQLNLNQKDQLITSIKYGLIFDGLSLLPTSSRQLGGSFGYFRQFRKGRSVSFSLDYSQLRVGIGRSVGSASMASFGVSFGF